jgi:RNA polymerase sigma factor
VAAKQSTEVIERLIADFTPFMHARVAKYASRCGEAQRGELFSAAMLAFYEAIQKYDSAKGHFFLFANRVVCARIIDCLRSINRHEGQTVPLEEEDDDCEAISPQSAALNELSMRSYNAEYQQELLVNEIEQYKAELATWGITLGDLSKHSPKHQKLRETYRTVVSKIIQTPDIVQTIQLKRYFPIKVVAELTELPPKKLERARIYILAALIIRMGDYDLLADYVR